MSHLIPYFLEPQTVCLKTYMNNILVKHEYTALYCAKQEFNIIVTFEKIGCVSQDSNLKKFQSCSKLN